MDVDADISNLPPSLQGFAGNVVNVFASIGLVLAFVFSIYWLIRTFTASDRGAKRNNAIGFLVCVIAIIIIANFTDAFGMLTDVGASLF